MHRFCFSHLIATLVGALAIGTSSAEPIVQSLAPPTLRVLTAEQARAQAEQLDLLVDGLTEVTALAAFPRTQGGRASLQPLYSAQAGSWPFESFVHAGLFKVIASFQTSHPRMLQISGGHLSLAQVRQQLGDSQALRPHKDGYLLTYPLIIAPGATLSVEDTTLYLYAHSGAAIINQGRLQIIKSRVESWSGEDSQGRAYRPFIMAWAGSQTRIVDSQLLRLGYNAHLARGLSAARSSQQPAGTPPARLLIKDSRLEQLSSVQLHDVEARIENSDFKRMQLYAVDAENGRITVRDNRIEDVRNHSGIRLSGDSLAMLQGNDIRRTGKAGLELSGFSGRLLARENRLHGNATYAFQLREMSPQGVAVLRKNHLASASQNLVDVQGNGRLLLTGNQLENAGNAIYLRGGGQTLILDNHFAHIEHSGINAEELGSILLGGNSFDAKVILQKLFQGKLLPVQSHIVDATITHGCHLQISAPSEHATLAMSPCHPAP